jgi:hypothetical protein
VSDTERIITLSPAPNQFGDAEITVTVSDGTTADDVQTSFTLTVDPINDLPTISSIGVQNVLEDMPTADLSFTVADVETPAASLGVVGTSNNPSVVAPGGIELSGAGGARMVRITPVANASGTATITLTVTDDNLATAVSMFDVNVASVNDAPTISTISPQTVNQGMETGPLGFTIGDIETAPAVLVMLTPVAGNPLLVDNIVLGGSGSMRNVNVIPSIHEFGMTTITLTVRDGDGAETESQFLLTVLEADAPPTVIITTPVPVVINEDAGLTQVDITVDDPDTGPGGLIVTATSGNQSLIADGSFNVVAGAGVGEWTIEFSPVSNAKGTVTITVEVTDPS